MVAASKPATFTELVGILDAQLERFTLEQKFAACELALARIATGISMVPEIAEHAVCSAPFRDECAQVLYEMILEDFEALKGKLYIWLRLYQQLVGQRILLQVAP